MLFDNKKSYIYYISPNNKKYITYNFKPISQMMRIYIAEDLNIKDLYNWKEEILEDNIKKRLSF